MSSSPLPSASHSPKQPSWRETWRVYVQPASVRMLLLGFAAGLPLLLVLGTLSFRLSEAGIERATIGFLSWVGLVYAFKWLWAPLVDRLPLPWLTRWLGRRRSWLLLAQCLVIAGLVGMALTDPRVALSPLVWSALLVAFGSATQDIALDAFRIESANAEQQAALAATYQTGYRLAMIWAGAGVLWLAARFEVPQLAGQYQHAAWRVAWLAMAVSMLPGMLTVLLSAEPAPRPLPPRQTFLDWLDSAVKAPFQDFFERYGKQALVILALIAVYRISDVVMGIMANPFYVEMGYTKDEVAAVSKVFGVLMTLAGAFVGGLLSARWGMMRVLMLGAILSAATNVLFVWLCGRGHDVVGLVWVVSADNLAGGIASVAFVAWLSSLTNVQYTATQYALFTSLMLLFPKWLAGFSGQFVDHFGYAFFFAGTALLGLPVFFLVVWVAHIQKTKQ